MLLYSLYVVHAVLGPLRGQELQFLPIFRISNPHNQHSQTSLVDLGTIVACSFLGCSAVATSRSFVLTNLVGFDVGVEISTMFATTTKINSAILDC